MTEYEKALELSRLIPKLKLWETAGFSQFLSDLEEHSGNLVSIGKMAESLRKIYTARMRGLSPKTKFEQTKIPFK